MARITNATRNLLRAKVLEKSKEKRDALTCEIQKLSGSLDAETAKMKAKALTLIKAEFGKFDAKVEQILANHGLKFKPQAYSSYTYTVSSIINDCKGRAYICDSADDKIEPLELKGDRAVTRLENLRADLKELDAKRGKACDDIELRIALGARFDEVVDAINNLQF